MRLSRIAFAFGLVLAIVAAPYPAGVPTVLAATFVVNSTADEVDANPGDGACLSASGFCTLRAAIVEANARPGSDIVNVPTGTYLITIAGINEDNGATGDLDVRDHLTIAGAGQATTILDGNGAVIFDRVFDIAPGIGLTMSNVTVRGGRIGSANGGGIHSAGVLNIVSSTIANSTVVAGTGFGGGIYSTGDLTIQTSTISQEHRR